MVFFDEIDALAPSRGASVQAGGVMDRIVSQLMAELDGVHDGDATVFVLGATNRPDLVDASLIRPGRFDRMVRVAPPETHAQQALVLEALTRRFSLGDDVRLIDLTEQLPLTLSGADLYALCAGALTRALLERAASVTSEPRQEAAGIDKSPVIVRARHFAAARMEIGQNAQ